MSIQATLAAATGTMNIKAYRAAFHVLPFWVSLLLIRPVVQPTFGFILQMLAQDQIHLQAVVQRLPLAIRSAVP